MSWMAVQTGGRVIYSVKTGSIIPQARAQEIGEYIEGLEKVLDITPQNLVDDARGKDSKLHEFFEWNNKKAAESHRCYQARKIVNHFEIVIVDVQTEEESTTRAWHSVVVASQDTLDDPDGKDGKGEPVRAFVNTLAVFAEPDYKAQAVDNALREVNGWRRRFSIYSELEPIFVGIDEVEKGRD